MKLSIRDLDLRGKRVFVRVDFNVPLENGGVATVADDTRIRASIPTIQYALAQGATVVLASHLGRPKGQVNLTYSLKPVSARLSKLLCRPVTFAEDCIGDAARAAIEKVHTSGGGVVLLENLRFHPEEERNDAAFARQLASLADLYVDDAFGASHRAHASVDTVARCMPSAAAGLLMERELEYLGRVLTSPERPLVAILGGAKVSDKIEVIQNFLGRVDRLIIGGAMAYTFFKARGVPVGRSLVEDDKLDAARGIEAGAKDRGLTFALPLDHVVTGKIEAGTPRETSVVSGLSRTVETLKIGDPAIGDRMGVDIGPETVRAYSSMIGDAKTVVWNGPMGVFEIPEFAEGTNAIARAVADVKGTTIVGGGDSIAAIHQAGVADRISHISTGGGASLEFLGGRTLPGVAALTEK